MWGAGKRERASVEVFVARQPIFTAQQRVYGYELLFRDGVSNVFPKTDPGLASQKVISSTFLSAGLESLTRGRRAFINFTRELLLDQHALLLPAQSAVIEIVEDVVADEEVVAACEDLRRQGYLLALDDFTTQSDPTLLDVVDFVKLDFGQTTPQQRRGLVERLTRHDVQIVAEKVETRGAFAEARDLGCSHFQGFFFARPVVLSGQDLTGHRGSYLQLLREAREPELDFQRLERTIKQDLSLSYKLLRYINTVAFGWRQRIESVQHALVLLGEESVRRWAALVTLSSLADQKPQELAIVSAVRARLCEDIGQRAGLNAWGLELFMMGMFSLIDAVLDLPMERALVGIPFSDDARNALLGTAGPLRDVLDTVVAYERGHWGEFDLNAKRLGVEGTQLPVLYQHAVEWAGVVFE